MLGVDSLAVSADLEAGYHLRCRSKGMVTHRDAACMNVLGRILYNIEFEFQGLVSSALPFLVKRRYDARSSPRTSAKLSRSNQRGTR